MKLATTKSYLVKGAATVGALAASAQFAMAQNIQGNPIKAIPLLNGKLTTIVSNLIQIILLVAGVLAVVYLVWGGIMYITAGGDAEKATKGRTAITNAIIGVIIIMASFAIYRAVISSSSQGSSTSSGEAQTNF